MEDTTEEITIEELKEFENVAGAQSERALIPSIIASVSPNIDYSSSTALTHTIIPVVTDLEANIVLTQPIVERVQDQKDVTTMKALESTIEGTQPIGEGKANYHVPNGNSAPPPSVTPEHVTPQVNTGKGKSKKSKKGNSSSKNSS